MKKEEVKCIDDIKKLKKEEQAKWEMAVELGLFDKVVEGGWKSLTSRESGRIGGMLSARHKDKKGELKVDKKSEWKSGKELDFPPRFVIYLIGDWTGLFFMRKFLICWHCGSRLIYGGENRESKDYFSMYRMQAA